MEIEQEEIGQTRTKRACTHCRKNKVKCSGTHPSCARCLSKGLVCTYQNPKHINKKKGINLVKEKVANLEVEINVQKQLADYWKRMFDQIVPKMPIKASSVADSVNVPILKLKSQNIPPYERIEMTEDILYIINGIKGFAMPFTGAFSNLEMENVAADWDLLTTKVIPTSDLEKYGLPDLVHLWAMSFLFIVPCIHNFYPYQEHVLWSNAVKLMKLVLYGKELNHNPQFLPRIICILLNMHRYCGLTNRYGAQTSSILLAYRLAINSRAWIAPILMDIIICELIFSSTTSSERKQWIELKFESANELLLLRHNLAYCMSALMVTQEIDFAVGMDLSIKLNEAEKLADVVHKDIFNNVIKCCTHALRSEVAHRQGYKELASEWFESSYRLVLEFTDYATIRFLYSFLLIALKNLNRLSGESTKTSVLVDLTRRLQETWPELISEVEGTRAIFKHLISAILYSPQLQWNVRSLTQKLESFYLPK